MRRKKDAYPGLTVYRDLTTGEARSATPLRFHSIFEKTLFLRTLINTYARRSEIRGLAASIIQSAGVPARDFYGQADAILHYVQRNVKYIGELEECFATPIYTLQQGFGDCDDQVTAFAALVESITIPTRIVVMGRSRPLLGGPSEIVTYTEGMRSPPLRASYFHVYCEVGLPPKKSTEWLPAEPTMQQFRLGDSPIEYLKQLDSIGAAFPS